MTTIYKDFIIEKDDTITSPVFYLKRQDGDTFLTSIGLEMTIDSICVENLEAVKEYLEALYY